MITRDFFSTMIVPLELFLSAQEILTARSLCLSDEELLDCLKLLYAHEGQFSEVLINQMPDMPSFAAYRNRFGSLARACEMIRGNQMWSNRHS